VAFFPENLGSLPDLQQRAKKVALFWNFLLNLNV
jgi:hypothetical protein